VEVQDSCTDGTNDGRTRANQMWKAAPYKSNCAYAFSSANPSIDKGASDLKAKYYPDNTGNWQTDAFNQCARDYGVDPTVNDIKSNCFMNADTCLDLGKTAASIIAYEYASTHDCDIMYKSNSGADYEQDCRDVAISYCSGQVYTAVQKMCPRDMPSTTELTSLIDDCTDEVNNLVPPPTKPTRKPTKRPTRKPTPMPTTDKGSCARVPISDFCSAARHCCSSASKYNDHKSFCTYYGFPPKDGDDSMTTLSLFNYVDSGITVDCTQCGQSKCSSRTAYDDLEHYAENFEAELDTVEVANY
jgi:hypothetical protein